MMDNRPKVKARTYEWRATDGAKTPGVGISQNGRTIAHYTATEARQMADRLHDLADKLETVLDPETTPE